MKSMGYVLGVDVGGTKVLAGYVRGDGTVVCSKRYPMDRSNMASALASVYGAAADFLKENQDKPQPLAAGFGLVGRCDPAEGKWVQAVNIPITESVELAAEIKRRHGFEAYLDNDVFCATQAEIRFGAGKRYKDFVLVNIGTGLSMGIVADGRLIRGAGNVAGEIGQCLLSPDNADETLEQRASGGGMAARALAKEGLGKEQIEQIEEDAFSALSWVVSSIIAVFNPEAVVLAGGVACVPGLVERFRRYAADYAYPSSMKDLKEICLSPLDARTVGLIGAASVAWQGIEATGRY